MQNRDLAGHAATLAPGRLAFSGVPGPRLTVCAVVRGEGPAMPAALDAQTRPAGERLVVPLAASHHDAMADARESPADWLWLLDAGVVPEPAALERLVAPLDDLFGLPPPALMASRVVHPDGRLDRAGAPWLPLLDRDVVIAAAQHRLVSLRLARWGSLLVRRETLAEHGLPRADYAGGADDLEWTGRVLKDAHGYLAPDSVAVRGTPARRTIGPREVRDRLRMLRSPGWVAQEPVWFAVELVADLGRAVRACA